MILQALKDYYDRKAEESEAEIAPPGLEYKEIPYIIVLNPEGSPIDLLSTYEGTGKERRAKQYLVPKSVKRSIAVNPNLLWDNPEYVLGIDLKGRPERVKEQHDSFIHRIRSLGEIHDEGLDGVLRFLELTDKESLLKKFDNWEELINTGANLSFSLSGDKGLVLERRKVREAVTSFLHKDSDGDLGTCMISGDRQIIERLHPAIKGVRGAQSTGANIVSFNLDAFSSYNKKQGANSPISKSSAFAYTTALNHLLRKDSRQKIQVGDATTVFWADKPNDLETGFVDIFGEPPKDDPDRGVKAVRSLFKSVETGAYADDEGQTRFYVLGLAPNASRISIRFWVVDTVADMARKILQHFEDLSIVHGPKDKETLSLFRLLVSIAVQGKSENIPPNLAGEVMRSILEGLPYPQTLLQAVIRRIRAEHEITYARASLIKACINRSHRIHHLQNKEELKVSLDTSNTHIGYRLGRLFATLEKIQAEANPGINATIRDRFYGAASGTPVAVFSNLMRLKNHHLAKLESPGRRIYFEKLIAEILESVSDFPKHLSLEDQGRFAIGYYHQNQHFFTKKESKSESGSNHQKENEP